MSLITSRQGRNEMRGLIVAPLFVCWMLLAAILRIPQFTEQSFAVFASALQFPSRSATTKASFRYSSPEASPALHSRYNKSKGGRVNSFNSRTLMASINVFSDDDSFGRKKKNTAKFNITSRTVKTPQKVNGSYDNRRIALIPSASPKSTDGPSRTPSPSSRIVSPAIDRRSYRGVRGKVRLFSSYSRPRDATPPGLVASIQAASAEFNRKVAASMPKMAKYDLTICAAYVCTIIAISMPVVLLPVIAMDPLLSASAAETSNILAPVSGAAFVAAVASLSTLGGAAGKFVNGFVCQWKGGRNSARFYLIGLSMCTFLLSVTSSLHGWAVFGMEFFNSIMWTACTVLLANHYENDAKKFATSIMALSLASTMGTIAAKTGGVALLRHMHWRQVARISAAVALLGAIIVHTFVTDDAREQNTPNKAITIKRPNSMSWKGIVRSAHNVAGSRMFWIVGLAHAMSFMARQSDKILGSFFQDVTNLPSYMCGGLTSCVTLGFAYGLVSGRKFQTLTSPFDQSRFLTNRYKKAILSALGLALCANNSFANLLGSRKLLAAVIAMLSGTMASAMSFQFYQLPSAFSKSFGEDKAICTSFLDSVGFFIGAPIWALTSRLVGSDFLGSYGWSVAWTIIALWLTLGGGLMMKAAPSLLDWKQSLSK